MFAKGFMTADARLAEATYMRWLAVYGDVVELWKRGNNYEVVVNPCVVRTKGTGDFVVEG
jgi:hypothetical protein